MTKHSENTKTATCDNNVLAVVVIGKKSFKNAEEFKDYADDMMHDFLDNIQDLNGYTYPADGDSLFEYEEGITFYYTKKRFCIGK